MNARKFGVQRAPDSRPVIVQVHQLLMARRADRRSVAQLAKDLRLPEADVRAACERLVKTGVVRRVGVDSWPARACYYAPVFKPFPFDIETVGRQRAA